MIDWPSFYIGAAAMFLCAPGIFSFLFWSLDTARDLWAARRFDRRASRHKEIDS